MDGENDPRQPDEYIMGMIRGEHVYVPQQGAYREDLGIAVREGAYREGAGEEGVREDERKEDVSSFRNPSGDGMEIKTFDDEGRKTPMTNGNRKQTPLARYVDLSFGETKGICIYVLTTLSFFSPPDRANHILNEARAKS
jgi:hypothetical protein